MQIRDERDEGADWAFTNIYYVLSFFSCLKFCLDIKVFEGDLLGNICAYIYGYYCLFGCFAKMDLGIYKLFEGCYYNLPHTYRTFLGEIFNLQLTGVF